MVARIPPTLPRKTLLRGGPKKGGLSCRTNTLGALHRQRKRARCLEFGRSPSNPPTEVSKQLPQACVPVPDVTSLKQTNEWDPDEPATTHPDAPTPSERSVGFGWSLQLHRDSEEAWGSVGKDSSSVFSFMRATRGNEEEEDGVSEEQGMCRSVGGRRQAPPSGWTSFDSSVQSLVFKVGRRGHKTKKQRGDLILPPMCVAKKESGEADSVLELNRVFMSSV